MSGRFRRRRAFRVKFTQGSRQRRSWVARSSVSKQHRRGSGREAESRVSQGLFTKRATGRDLWLATVPQGIRQEAVRVRTTADLFTLIILTLCIPGIGVRIIQCMPILYFSTY